jgi:hypothetical protein
MSASASADVARTNRSTRRASGQSPSIVTARNPRVSISRRVTAARVA